MMTMARLRRAGAALLALLALAAGSGAPARPVAAAPLAGGLVIPLYPAEASGAPVPEAGFPAETRVVMPEMGETMMFNVSVPTLERFAPPKGRGNGTAVIVAPGGGFVGIGYRAGGTAIAQRLAGLGITAFVLKYRTIASPDDAMRVEAHLRAVGLPWRMADIPGGLPDADALLGFITQDKKVSRGALTFILTRGIGQSFIARDVPASEVLSFLRENHPG